MYVLYTDNSILAGPDNSILAGQDQKEINKAIEDIKSAKLLDITVEGGLQDFLGVKVERRLDGTINLTQPHLIDQILEENAKTKAIPAVSSSKQLSRHSDSPDFDGAFNYRPVIGKYNCLEKGSRSDIA